MLKDGQAHLTKLTNLVTKYPRDRLGREQAVEELTYLRNKIDSPIVTILGISNYIGSVNLVEISDIKDLKSLNQLLIIQTQNLQYQLLKLISERLENG